MNKKITTAILFCSISVIFISSYHAFDSQLKFNAFAQTPGNTNAGPIPEGNYTINDTGPIPEDNSTDPTVIANPMDMAPDANSLNPEDNGTVPTINNMTNPDNMPGLDNMTGPENLSPHTGMHMPTNNGTNVALDPLEQIKAGVSPKDVTCKQGFVLIIKADDGSPACVDPQVMQILTQRGW